MNLAGSKWSNLIVIPLLVFLITSLNYYTTNKQVEETACDVWGISAPEAENMNPALLDEMMEVISEERLPVDSVIIVRNGCIVKEEYPSSSIKPYTKRKLYSATKSITSALIGIAIQEGYIEGVDQKIMEYFPDRTVTEQDRRLEITIGHLLTMTPGYQWTNGDGGAMRASADPVQYVLDKPMIQTPGAMYNYGDGAPFLLGAILSKATGMSTLEFATEHLFDPLNITDVYWENNGDQYFAASGLHLRPRDMAKIGYLFLNDGKSGDEQIISQDWVRESTQTHLSGSGFMAGDEFYVDGYGYLWWTYPESGVYYASGLYEQRIYVCPELDLVIVFTSHNNGGEVTPRLLFQYILPACEEYTPIRYSKYGVSFSYPRGMKLVEAPSPLVGGEISEESGFVQAYFSHPYQSISMMWYPMRGEMELDAEMNRLFALIESEKTIIKRGLADSIYVDGNNVLYLSANVTENGHETSGMIGCWLSEDTERVILSYYITDPSVFTKKEIKSTFIDQLVSIRDQ